MLTYYAIKFTDENWLLISKFTDAFQDDYEEYKNNWFVFPINRPWKPWWTMNGLTMRERFPKADQNIPIQVVREKS